jgi:hypothetical protein
MGKLVTAAEPTTGAARGRALRAAVRRLAESPYAAAHSAAHWHPIAIGSCDSRAGRARRETDGPRHGTVQETGRIPVGPGPPPAFDAPGRDWAGQNVRPPAPGADLVSEHAFWDAPLLYLHCSRSLVTLGVVHCALCSEKINPEGTATDQEPATPTADLVVPYPTPPPWNLSDLALALASGIMKLFGLLA